MTQFENDLNKPMQGAKNKGIYNLIVSKRDMGLYCHGMKIHRNWKVSDVKIYFGLKGKKEDVYQALCDMVQKHVYNK